MDLLKIGVNKNISILMLFDCVLVNTGLGFHRDRVMRRRVTDPRGSQSYELAGSTG
jgi:hypothetical protein